ncbi:S15 family peptidase, partial [mine drainage metagenome]
MDSEAVLRLVVEHDVPAQMRDGTMLRADIYRPDGDGPYPVLLTRLPYGKDVFRHPGLDPLRGAMRDYIVVVQDVRGRFRSEGKWTPFQQEFDDGYDSVVWAASLPGSDGRVAMFGGSYLGMTQWSAAVTSPPGLVAMAPIISAGN